MRKKVRTAEKPPTDHPEVPTPPPASLWLLVGVAVVVLLSAGTVGWQIWPSARTDEELGSIKQALQQERDKSEKMTRQLDKAWRELRLQAVALADVVAEKQELVELRVALSQQSDANREALAQAAARNRALEEQLLARWDVAPNGGQKAPDAPLEKLVPTPATDKPAASSAVTNDKPVAPPPEKLMMTPTTTSDKELVRLMARARSLLEQGNISAARIVLEHAAEAGNSLAIFALAQTYDPSILSDWGTFGTLGDAAKAQELYARAIAGGYQKADDRLNALRH